MLQNDSQELDAFLFEYALFGFEEQVEVGQLGEDSVDAFLVVGRVIVRGDQHIIHVDDEPSLMYFVLEDGVHHHLESGWEFVRPKNMTVGSNSPSLVIKAAFHSSPLRMRTLLYPHRMSNLVNKARARALLMSWGINGRGYVFRTVHWFSRR